ncbi:MAG: tryptophan synthase subunit alpha [Deltaproteobacteria bacterium]|nr:tryptophan synthase subunit alpha [Deltaproteobacteria bacterium]
MTRIPDCFAELKKKGETALIPFVTVGDPDLETSEMLIPALAQAGADLIELGVPFSDPVAEGPVIEKASERALAAGVSLQKILDMVKRVRTRVEIPLILMGYANPFLHMGAEKFVREAEEAGVDGVIIPDLPPEEGEAFFKALDEKGISTILLAAPTTRDDRMDMIASRSTGFMYYVSLRGVTGAREGIVEGLEERVRSIRENCPLPVCVGFGVSTPEQVAEIGRYADGVVVGSALVRVIEQAGEGQAVVDAAADFVTKLKAPLKSS